MANVTYLPNNNNIKLGGEKVIALTQNNIDLIKSSYNKDAKVVASQTVESNKDLLSQSFGGNPVTSDIPVMPAVPNSPVVEPQVNVVDPSVNNVVVPEIPVVPNVSESQIDVSSVGPIIQDLEKTSVNMDTVGNVTNNNVGLESSVNIPNVEMGSPVNSIVEPVKENTQFVDNSNSNLNLSNPILQTELPSVETNNNVILSENEFKVSDQPNIFDNAFNDLNVETVNAQTSVKTDNVSTLETVNDLSNTVNNVSLFETKPAVPSVTELKKTSIVSESNDVEYEFENSLSEDFLEAQIAIQKSNYKLFTNLAENSKKMAELLEKQMKTNNKETNLEHTASDLFNSNGALDENKVLGLVA